MPSPELSARLARVRLLVFDVDGVLTDGTLGSEAAGGRRWSVIDGFGCFLARQAGLELALCSGKDHPEVRQRAELMRVSGFRLGRIDKAAAVDELLNERGLEGDAALYTGDDLFDLPAMARCGLSACPADARPELTARVDWVLAARGGSGVAREVIEGVLRARGLWNRVTAPFLGGEHG